ncbi:hypothetical protein [Acanthamoeba polyphaga mimivirus]|nr:hypothetical protein [Acanthamoeba polyphaga mimivirus]
MAECLVFFFRHLIALLISDVVEFGELLLCELLECELLVLWLALGLALGLIVRETGDADDVRRHCGLMGNWRFVLFLTVGMCNIIVFNNGIARMFYFSIFL